MIGQTNDTPFRNFQVDMDSLAHVGDLDFVPLEARYVRLRVGLALAVLLAVLVLYFVEGVVIFLMVGWVDWPRSVAGFMALLAIVLSYPCYRYHSARAMGYAVREHDVALRRGLFWIRQTIQPIRRVQHIELNRGPLEKRLGLASLTLYSAGSTGATFRIPGLSLLTASRLRRFVLRHSDQ